MMRIIGGVWRSRRLVRPENDATRPMPDRVKQAIFDMLGTRLGTLGGLPPILVGDFFAGSGSMGLEALSRGAERCWFFERDQDALAALRDNMQALDAGSNAIIVGGDAWKAVPPEVDGRRIELIFLDPPYRDAIETGGSGPVGSFMRRIAEAVDENATTVLHHPADVLYDRSPGEPWQVLETRVFGTSGVTFFSR